MWKPLLRLFRRYLKRDALHTKTYANIREMPIQDQGVLLAQALEVPIEIASSLRTQNIIQLLVNSHRVVYRKQLIPKCQALMSSHIGELWPLFFEIF